jgi:hypothetical protein
MAPEPVEPVAPPPPPPPAEPAPVELRPVTPAEPELDVAAMGQAEPELPAMAPTEPELEAEQPAAVTELPPVQPQPVENHFVAPEQVPAPPPPPAPAEPEMPVLVAPAPPAPVEEAPVAESTPVDLPMVESLPAPPEEPAIDPSFDLNGAAPRPGAFRVVVRLSDGDGVEVGEFGDFGTAMAGAQEVIDQFANSNGSWPFYAGRFIRPDLIVSVDVVDGASA